MYIAICDDNVADRKHLERLLSRESDKRIGSPNILYIESFGRKEHLLNNPFKYDLFIIDMTSTADEARELVLELKKMGIDAPIVMYSSTIDYTLDSSIPDDIVHMRKPYIPDPLPKLLELGDKHVIGTVISAFFTINGSRQPVPVNDIYYIYSSGNGSNIVLQDQREIEVEESLIDVYCLLEPYKEFYLLKKNAIINLKYTSLITYFTVLMQDYAQFHYNPFKYNELKELKEKIDRL